jgi:predicted anti-sigma-YlaC factor YlaD
MSRRWLRFVARANPSCREAMIMFSRSLDRPPGRVDRVIFAIHLLHCPACRRSRRQISLLVAALRRSSRRHAGDSTEAIPGLPPEVRERIKRALRRE